MFSKNTLAPEKLVSKMRASFVLAPLLAIKHKAIIPMPGGCKIGERPIDFHIKALEKPKQKQFMKKLFKSRAS